MVADGWRRNKCTPDARNHSSCSRRYWYSVPMSAPAIFPARLTFYFIQEARNCVFVIEACATNIWSRPPSQRCSIGRAAPGRHPSCTDVFHAVKSVVFSPLRVLSSPQLSRPFSPIRLPALRAGYTAPKKKSCPGMPSTPDHTQGVL